MFDAVFEQAKFRRSNSRKRKLHDLQFAACTCAQLSAVMNVPRIPNPIKKTEKKIKTKAKKNKKNVYVENLIYKGFPCSATKKRLLMERSASHIRIYAHLISMRKRQNDYSAQLLVPNKNRFIKIGSISNVNRSVSADILFISHPLFRWFSSSAQPWRVSERLANIRFSGDQNQ